MICLILCFWCNHLHTSSLAFIVLSIKSNIVDKKKGKSRCFIIEWNFLTHIHTASLTYIIIDIEELDPWGETIAYIARIIISAYHRTIGSTPVQAVYIRYTLFKFESFIYWKVVTDKKASTSDGVQPKMPPSL